MQMPPDMRALMVFCFIGLDGMELNWIEDSRVVGRISSAPVAI